MEPVEVNTLMYYAYTLKMHFIRNYYGFVWIRICLLWIVWYLILLLCDLGYYILLVSSNQPDRSPPISHMKHKSFPTHYCVWDQLLWKYSLFKGCCCHVIGWSDNCINKLALKCVFNNEHKKTIYYILRHMTFQPEAGLMLFSSPEHEGLHLVCRVRISLSNEWHGDTLSRPLQHHVLSWKASVTSLHPEVQSQVLTVAQDVVPQKFLCKTKQCINIQLVITSTSWTEAWALNILALFIDRSVKYVVS